MSETWTVRAANDSDWPMIWPILREIAAVGETYTYPRALDEDRARRLWQPMSPGAVIVAMDGAGRVIGSAKIGANQLGPGGHVATASFVVASSARGQGAGRALGEAALAAARDLGFRAMQFNAVVSSNTAAVALWQTLGFVIVGRVPEAFQRPSGEFVELLVMHRNL